MKTEKKCTRSNIQLKILYVGIYKIHLVYYRLIAEYMDALICFIRYTLSFHNILHNSLYS